MDVTTTEQRWKFFTSTYPVEAIARESVTLLCDMLEGGPQRHVTLDYTLQEGESVGPCPQ